VYDYDSGSIRHKFIAQLNNATTQQNGAPGAREIISIKTPPHPAERERDGAWGNKEMRNYSFPLPLLSLCI